MRNKVKKMMTCMLVFLLVMGLLPGLSGEKVYAASSYVISTVAGKGTSGFSGDGEAAIAAQLAHPYGVAVDSSGNLYIADSSNYRVRKIDATTGLISTVAGSGDYGYSGDGGPAISAKMKRPLGIAVDSSGNLFIADNSDNRIRKVDTSGYISTVACAACYPEDITVDNDGNLFIVDAVGHVVRKIDTTGQISTVAGTGTSGYSGDNEPATMANLQSPQGIAIDSSGNLYIADTGNNVIRKVDTAGLINTVAGTGAGGYSGDGDDATLAKLYAPKRVSVDSSGNLYISDYMNSRIRKVDTAGQISTVAGSGAMGYSGDGELATSAQLFAPHAIAVDSNGIVYIADTNNNRIRKLGPASSNANLSDLSLSDVMLSPAFAADTTSYTASVENSRNSIDVMPTVSDSTAKVTVNDTLVAGLPVQIVLNEGSNTITIVVTAQDGTTQTYKVIVMREAAPTYTIGAIPDHTASPLIQGYASGTQEAVTISIMNTGTGNLTGLTATLSVPDGNNFIISDPDSSLDSGAPATSFTIKAKDGLATGTYTATVTISANNMTDVTFAITQVVVSGSGGSDSGSGYVPLEPTTGITGVDVLVNGKVESAGTATTVKQNDRTVTTVSVDQKKLEGKLATEGQGAIVTIPVQSKSDAVISELNGQMVKSMENKQATLKIQTDHATYTLPALQININAISDQVGKSVVLQDIKVQIEIATPTADIVKVVNHAAEKGMFSLVVPSIDFTVRAVHGDTIVEVSKFNAYVERAIAIPDGVDPNKITTGIVVDPDGTVRHVPTKIVTIDGKYYAVINSLTNSTYSVVWHPLEFSDVANHWAKDAVNDMGSRMVIDGTGNGMFSPDRDITRAEFAAIIVRGLGLKLENGASEFTDVKAADWYSSAINTAYAYHLIDGFVDGTFRPNDKITREEAMVIVAKAMALTNLKDKLPVQSTDLILRPYIDAAEASVWARSSIADCVQAGIVLGKSITKLAPKDHMTRAEVVTIIERLLQKSELI